MPGVDISGLITAIGALITALLGAWGLIVRERSRHEADIEQERKERAASEGNLLGTVTKITDDLVKDLYGEIKRLRDARDADRREYERELLALRVRLEALDAINTKFLAIFKRIDVPLSDETVK